MGTTEDEWARDSRVSAKVRYVPECTVMSNKIGKFQRACAFFANPPRVRARFSSVYAPSQALLQGIAQLHR